MTSNEFQPATDRPLDRSAALLERARELIPGCSQTGSKGPTHFVQGVAPTHLESGDGCHVWDVDGNEYVDYVSSLGPILLGHDYPPVTAAVQSQVEEGTMFSLPHPLQVDVAERLTEMIPGAEMVRFAKSGNDVTTVAAKLARAHTGRDVIATQGYHGWPDVWMADTTMDAGIPDAVGEYTEGFDYNDIESLESIFDAHPDDVAAVVTTPVNLAEPEDGFLERVRALCDEHGAVLVFDEVLTGFRFAPGGAAEYFGVTPDLGCYAKGIANGYSLSAIAGRREIMETMTDDEFFFSMTYAGSATELAAARATLDVLRDEPVHEHIFEKGEALMAGIEERIAAHGLDDHVSVSGFPCRFQLSFREEGTYKKSLWMQECLRRGILTNGTHLLTYSHDDEDVAVTLDAYDAAFAVLADAIDAGDVAERLDGAPVGASLRERTGENEGVDG